MDTECDFDVETKKHAMHTRIAGITKNLSLISNHPKGKKVKEKENIDLLLTTSSTHISYQSDTYVVCCMLYVFVMFFLFLMLRN